MGDIQPEMQLAPVSLCHPRFIILTDENELFYIIMILYSAKSLLLVMGQEPSWVASTQSYPKPAGPHRDLVTGSAPAQTQTRSPLVVHMSGEWSAHVRTIAYSSSIAVKA